MSATVSLTGRQLSPVFAAPLVSASHTWSAPCPGGIHSGSSVQGSTSWASRKSSSTQVSRASAPTARAASPSQLPIVALPGGADTL